MHGRATQPTRPDHPLHEQKEEDELPQHELARLLYAQRQQRKAAPPAAVVTGKRRDQLDSLRRDIQALTEEIESLTRSRDLLISRQLHRFDDPDGSSVKAVVEYFRVLRRGLILSPVDAIAFLQATTAEDIRINSFMGRTVLIEQWKTHSMCWDDLDLQLDETMVIPLTDEEATVKCTVTFTMKISRLTLAVIFPHVLQSKSLVKRLLGKTLEGRARHDFVYNRKKKQFERLTIALGVLWAFSKLLREPAELSALFSRALFTDNFFVGDVVAAAARSSARQEEASRQDDSIGPRVSTLHLEETKRESQPSQDKMRLDHIL